MCVGKGLSEIGEKKIMKKNPFACLFYVIIAGAIAWMVFDKLTRPPQNQPSVDITVQVERHNVFVTNVVEISSGPVVLSETNTTAVQAVSNGVKKVSFRVHPVLSVAAQSQTSSPNKTIPQ